MNPRRTLLIGLTVEAALLSGLAAFIWLRGTLAGDTPYCRACGYDLSGHIPVNEPGAGLCPECGADFRRPGGVVRGVRRTNLRWLVPGVACMVLPALFSFGMRAVRGPMNWYLPILPTGSLIAEVSGAPRGFTMGEWAELKKRTLSAEQERTLARGLIDLRKRRGFIDLEAQGWLEKAARGGVMEPGLLERYYAEMVEPRLVVPEAVKAGEPFEASVGVIFRGNSGARTFTLNDSKVLCGGFSMLAPPGSAGGVEGLAWGERVGRSKEDIAAVSIDEADEEGAGLMSRIRLRQPRSGTATPRASLVASGPGDARVRTVVWLIVSPSRSTLDAAWNEDGSPGIPADAVWWKRVELERTVRVERSQPDEPRP